MNHENTQVIKLNDAFRNSMTGGSYVLTAGVAALDPADLGQILHKVERDSPYAKTICTSRSFGRSVETFDEMAEALSAYTARAAEKMRRKGLATSHINMMVTTNTWKPDQAQYYATKSFLVGPDQRHQPPD